MLRKSDIFLYQIRFCGRHGTNSATIQVAHQPAKGVLETEINWSRVNAFFLNRTCYKQANCLTSHLPSTVIA